MWPSIPIYPCAFSTSPAPLPYRLRNDGKKPQQILTQSTALRSVTRHMACPTICTRSQAVPQFVPCPKFVQAHTLYTVPLFVHGVTICILSHTLYIVPLFAHCPTLCILYHNLCPVPNFEASPTVCMLSYSLYLDVP